MNRQVYKNKEAFLEQNAALGAELPYSTHTEIFREKVTIGNKVAPNRICAQAMEGCDGTVAGSPDELTLRRYLRFAKGGPGLIWYEAVATVPEARASAHQLMVHEDNIDATKRLLDQVR